MINSKPTLFSILRNVISFIDQHTIIPEGHWVVICCILCYLLFERECDIGRKGCLCQRTKDDATYKLYNHWILTKFSCLALTSYESCWVFMLIFFTSNKHHLRNVILNIWIKLWTKHLFIFVLQYWIENPKTWIIHSWFDSRMINNGLFKFTYR